MRYNCTDCNRPIPAGLAVIRSVSFERVTYCRECYTLRGIEEATLRETVASAVAPLKGSSLSTRLGKVGA